MASEKFPDDFYKYDKADMKSILDNTHSQIRDGYKTPGDMIIRGKFSKICVVGMGGSSIVGALLQTYLNKLEIPILLCKSYELPSYTDDKTLFIVISYSGNTEETLSCFKQIIRKTKNVVCMASGGKLEDLSKTHRLNFIRVPKGMQPRNSVPFQFFALVRVFQNSKLLANKSRDVSELINTLNLKTIAKSAAKLSEKFKDKIPIVYSSYTYYPVAYRIKTQFNETGKVHAFSHEISELCHNELVGYTLLKGKYVLLSFRLDNDHRRIQKRMDLLKKYIKRSGVDVVEIKLKGGMLNKIFSGMLLGDYLAYYLALRYKLDPSPVRLIENFKKDMGPFV